MIQDKTQQASVHVPPREYATVKNVLPQSGQRPPEAMQPVSPGPADDVVKVTPSSSTLKEETAAPAVKPENSVENEIQPSMVHLHMDVHEQDVQLTEKVFSPQAAENSGAVLALSLGLAITFLLLAFVGCRLRSLKRRARKRGPLNVHDPDYLINGMYL